MANQLDLLKQVFKILKYCYYLFYRDKIFFPKKSYSLLGEDLFINKYFKKKTTGFYIDVGCHHPISGNNTFLLYKKGWTGINFDISKFSIDLFKFFRKEDISIWCGISNKKGVRKIYYRKKINMLNTLNKEIAKIHFKNGYKVGSVKVNTLNYFLKKLPTVNKIDLLKIDVEGEELNVLKSISLKKYKPRLISIEIHNLKNMYVDDNNYFKKDKIYNYLIKKNFKLIWKKKYSFIFEKNNK
jgi:hypothetical protein